MKLEKGVARRMDLGREEGYALAKQGFDGIIKRLKDREDSKKISTSNSGMQTNPTTVPAVSQAQLFIENRVGTHLLATAAVSIQTCSHIICSPSTSVHTQTESPALTTDATPFKNGRKTYESLYNKRNLLYNTGFSPLSPSGIVSNSPTSSTATTAFEMRSTTAKFIPKVEKVENLPILPPKLPQTHSLITSEHLDDIARVHTSLQTINNIVSQPLAPTTTSSSSQHQPCTDHQQSVFLRKFSQSEPPHGVPGIYSCCFRLRNTSRIAQVHRK